VRRREAIFRKQRCDFGGVSEPGRDRIPIVLQVEQFEQFDQFEQFEQAKRESCEDWSNEFGGLAPATQS
jgi:hypothetical protein